MTSQQIGGQQATGSPAAGPAAGPVAGVLDAWRKAVDAHRPGDVAALFAEDAVFQGLHPYTVGRAGVAEYYAGQPAGMTVTYRILRSRPLADDVVLGWVAVEFAFTDRPAIAVNLTVVVQRQGNDWQFAHYHVSPQIP